MVLEKVGSAPVQLLSAVTVSPSSSDSALNISKVVGDAATGEFQAEYDKIASSDPQLAPNFHCASTLDRI